MYSELTQSNTVAKRVALYQQLIDSGLLWPHRGIHSRIAEDLIDRGCCTKHGVGNE